VRELYARRGKTIPDFRTPESIVAMEAVILAEKGAWRSYPVCSESFLPGRVLHLSVKGVACHVGMIIDRGRFIHTWSGVGSVLIEPISRWERKIVGVYDYVD
jgi:cell wall-associated NlpC family hydrolase